MRSAPELMTKAIIIHNNLVRRAMWANFGTSIETEGGERGLHVSLQIAYNERTASLREELQMRISLPAPSPNLLLSIECHNAAGAIKRCIV